jgi:hypothetical protein
MDKANSAATPDTWLPPKEVAGWERISGREVYRRTQPGDPHFLVSRKRLDGKPGLEINPHSMTYDAQERRRQSLLRNVETPKPESAQLHLLPQSEIDRQIAALDLPEPQRTVVIKRFRIINPFLNHGWKVAGWPSIGACLKELAKQNEISQRSIQRLVKTYKQRENLEDLAKDRPGPPATGPGSKAFAEWDALGLDISLRAFVKGLWDGTLDGRKLRKRQIHSQVCGYLTEKQRGCGVSYVYPAPPSRATVSRFIDSLDALTHARRAGPDAIKAACGYIDRTYTDLASLERVETDEWKADVLTYHDAYPKIVRRFWLLTFYDCRGIYPLVWELVAGSEHELRHGIAEDDEINLLNRLIREYGVPGAIHSDRGRFRGKTFGGKPLGEIIDEKFARANGILDQLGIRHNMPRVHNPRGTRLERFHRYLADSCRDVPGWIGASTKERKMAPGDAQQAEHEEWVRGQRNTTPLLSRNQLLERINAWMEKWRDHESNGTDMRGLSPRAVFVHNTPPEGFRRISEETLAVVTAEHFENEAIETGGIIELRDGKRYSDPELLLIQGEHREVARLRHDDSFVLVLPARKGEQTVLAERRVPVGANDPANLAAQSEYLARVRKLVRNWAPKWASEENPQPDPTDPAHQTSSVEWMMNRGKQIIDAERFFAPGPEAQPEKSVPSLYDLKECTAEET